MQVPTLEQLFMASFSCIFLETLDFEGAERSVRDTIRKIEASGSRVDDNGTRIQTSFCVWTHTSGMTVCPVASTDDSQKRILQKSFTQALEYVRDSTESVTLVMHNVRTMFNAMANVQLMYDAAMKAREKFSNIIMVGAGFEIPTELTTVVHCIDFALPTKDELIDVCVEKILLPNYQGLAINVPGEEERPAKKESLEGFMKRRLTELNKDSLEDASKAATGLTPLAAENAFALSIISKGKLDAEVIQDQKRQAIRQSDVLEYVAIEDTMDSVGGFNLFKEWLSKRHRAFTDEAKKFGVTPPKGILLVGPPGNGKSLISRSIAASLKIPLLRFDVSKVFNHLVGASESKMRNALKVMEAIAPAVCWLDELEKSIAGSDASRSTDSGVSSRVLGQFLQWRQETKAPIFLCATCNNIKAIPPEFYRPGRIDAIFYTGMPGIDERMEIASIHIRKRNRDPDSVDLRKVGFATEGFTGAEIELSIIEAVFTAFSEDRGDVTTERILDAVTKIVPQSKRNKEEMQELEQWATERAMPVSKPKMESASKQKRAIAAVNTPPRFNN